MNTKQNLLKVATHNGIFHADEITAIALLKIFLDDDIKVTRVEHNHSDFNPFDMVVDVGQKLDGKKYFDHHQYKGGKSSAGFIWQYLGLEKKYSKISKLIKMVDDNDTGVKKAQEFEYPNLLKCFNNKDIYLDKQDEAFAKAVEFAVVTLNSMKTNQEEILKAKDIVANSYMFDSNPAILELDSFTPHWGYYINAQTMPHIKAVVWEDNGKWKVKLTPKRAGSFEVNGKKLPQNDIMKFVHSAGFFAVANDEKSMKKYIKKINLKV